MNRQLYSGILVVALFGGMIDSTATHAARLDKVKNPSFIEYGKGRGNSDYLLARLKGNIDQVRFNRVIEKTGLPKFKVIS